MKFAEAEKNCGRHAPAAGENPDILATISKLSDSARRW